MASQHRNPPQKPGSTMARALGLIALLLVLILLVAYLTWLFSMIAAFIWQGWVSAGKPGIWQILKNMYMAPWEGSEAVAKGPGQVQRVIVQQPMQTPSLKEPVGTVCKGVAAGERGFDCGVALSALNTVLLVWILVWLYRNAKISRPGPQSVNLANCEKRKWEEGGSK